jgi:hypothetical protein
MGRQKGVPNRRSQRAIELMDEMGADPLVGMLELALDTSNPPELRGRMFSELAKYTYPQLRAVEHTADVEVTAGDGSAVDELRRRLDAMRDDELEAMEKVGEAMDRIAREKVAQGEQEESLAAEQAALARASGARH